MIGRWFAVPLYPAVVASLLAVLIFRQRSLITLILVVLAGLLVGCNRGQHVFKDVQRYDELMGRTVTIEGMVLDDPVYDDNGQYDFRVSSVSIDGQRRYGQVRVKGRILEVGRGDTVEVSGVLRDGFGNYQASVYFASITVIAHSDSIFTHVRSRFFAAIYSVLPEPQASLGLGFLVGLRSTLPEDLETQLRVAGLTHIVVASGYNLTILVRIARRIFARWSRYQALVLSLGFILLFVGISGASPSIVRAAVVTVLSLVAWYFGRAFRPVLILTFSAAITAFYNPLYIWSDLGWWLSFLAFGGVMILAPLLMRRVFKEKKPKLLAQIAIESISAQLLTLPLVLYVFGNMSFVALAANLSVVPLIPLAMATTFVAGLSYIISSVPLGILVLPSNILLSYIVSATELFASPAWAQRSVHINRFTMVGMYALLVGVTSILYKRQVRTSQSEYSVID